MKKLLYIIGVAVIMFSCTTSEDSGITSNPEDLFTFRATEISSRVTDDGATLSWEADDQITIATDELSATYTMGDIFTGDMIYSSGELFYLDKVEPETFYAWSPAALTADADCNILLDLSDQSYVKQFVRSSATTTIAPFTPVVDFVFAPIYTKVTFYLSAGFSEVRDFTGATVELSGANTSAKYNYIDDTFSDQSSEEITSALVVDYGGTTASVTFYIIETLDVNSTLIISTSEGDFVVTISDKQWDKGGMYSYDITVGEKAPEMTLADFDEGGIYSVDQPSEDIWVITDVGAPTSEQFTSLKAILNTLSDRKIDLVFPELTVFPAYALDYAFYLNSFYAPKLEVIGSFAFERCIGLTGGLSLPSSLTYIGELSFYYCTALTDELTLPENLVTIEGGAFANCNFVGAIEIPATVTTLGHSAFENCDNITAISVYWTDSIPEVTEWTFPEAFTTSGALSISIPSGTKDIYLATSVWSNYNLTERID